MSEDIISSPDCRDGKHKSCTGGGWNLVLDEPADCSCHCHQQPDPTARVEALAAHLETYCPATTTYGNAAALIRRALEGK
jgi:hypothetical protein